MKDRGPAFPTKSTGYVDGVEYIQYEDGLSLRQYYAAKAMQAMIMKVAPHDSAEDIRGIPEAAFNMADLMIEQEEK